MRVIIPVACHVVHKPSSTAFSLNCVERIRHQLTAFQFPVRFGARVTTCVGHTLRRCVQKNKYLYVVAEINPPWMHAQMLALALPTISGASIGTAIRSSVLDGIKVIDDFSVLAVTLTDRGSKPEVELYDDE